MCFNKLLSPPPQPSLHSSLSSTHPPSTPLPLPTPNQHQSPLFSNFHQSLPLPLPPPPAIFSNAPVSPHLSTTFHSRLPSSTLHPNLLLLLPPPPLYSSNPAPHPSPTFQPNLPLPSKPPLLPSPLLNQLLPAHQYFHPALVILLSSLLGLPLSQLAQITNQSFQTH